MDRHEIEQRQGHQGGILWFTGLSGAGKSTLARHTRILLDARGIRSVVLDGDQLRAGLNRDLGFSEADREENMRRAAEVASLFLEEGYVVLLPMISPAREARLQIRGLYNAADYAEVYVKCQLTVCEHRDPKGLYAKARRGEIRQFTGIDAVYEVPEAPELIIDTEHLSIESSALTLADQIERRYKANPRWEDEQMKQEDEDRKELVRSQFTRAAADYVTSDLHARGTDLDLLVEWLEPRPEWTVLDVATGGGHVAKRISSEVGHVIAADLTPGMLEQARAHIQAAHPNVLFVIADAEQLPFLDASFDAVTCRIAAHHFPHPDQFLREATRVLKPGGLLLLIDNIVPHKPEIDHFINEMEQLRDESHVRCCHVDEWEGWMNEAGLSIVRSRVRKKAYDYPVWVRRTTRSEEEAARVTEFILQANPELQAYVGLQLNDGEITSLHIDEWMVMAKRIG